jgi:hypothetical protein
MKVDFDRISEHIGYLFYALASEDQKLLSSDLSRITDIIENVWKGQPNGDHSLHGHLTHCINEGIRYALDNRMESAEALQSFKTYFLMHPMAFGSGLRSNILSSADQIIKEFQGRSGSGVMERELQVLLQAPFAAM